MTSVQLALPDEILEQVNFPYDGVRDANGITLTAKGDGVDLTIDLPPNVSTQRLLEQLAPLLEKTPTSGP
jgi:hypothetical protein